MTALEGMEVMRCECGAEASRRVLVTTAPGSPDGKLCWIYLCESCWREDAELWESADLAGERGYYELAIGRWA